MWDSWAEGGKRTSAEHTAQVVTAGIGKLRRRSCDRGWTTPRQGSGWAARDIALAVARCRDRSRALERDPVAQATRVRDVEHRPMEAGHVPPVGQSFDLSEDFEAGARDRIKHAPAVHGGRARRRGELVDPELIDRDGACAEEGERRETGAERVAGLEMGTVEEAVDVASGKGRVCRGASRGNSRGACGPGRRAQPPRGPRVEGKRRARSRAWLPRGGERDTHRSPT